MLQWNTICTKTQETWPNVFIHIDIMFKHDSLPWCRLSRRRKLSSCMQTQWTVTDSGGGRVVGAQNWSVCFHANRLQADMVTRQDTSSRSIEPTMGWGQQAIWAGHWLRAVASVRVDTLYHRDDALLYIAYVVLIWATPIPADRGKEWELSDTSVYKRSLEKRSAVNYAI